MCVFAFVCDIWDDAERWYICGGLYCVTAPQVRQKPDTLCNPLLFSLFVFAKQCKTSCFGPFLFFFFCLYSCFCPQDVVEEAVLLLLITESMVRRAHTVLILFFIGAGCPDIFFPPLSIQTDQRWSGDQPPARPGRGSPGQPAGCHLRLWPAYHWHGQEGAVRHALWGVAINVEVRGFPATWHLEGFFFQTESLFVSNSWS